MATSGKGGPPRRAGQGRAPRRTAGQRAGVTRDEVLDAAHRLARRDGIEQLSMRKLAAALGVAPNALYTYFPTKLAILDAVFDAVLGGIQVPDVDAADWREGLMALMRASRAVMLAHPELTVLFITRPGGRNALRLGELTLQLLARGGVRDRAAVQALRALLLYTIGFTAAEAPRATDPSGPRRLRAARERIEALDPGAFPATRAVATHLAIHPGDVDFDAGLRWLLAGIANEV